MAEVQRSLFDEPQQPACKHCRKRPARPERKMCDHCTTVHNRCGKRNRLRMGKGGTCVRCFQPNDRTEKGHNCSACLKKYRERTQEIKRECLEGYGGVRCACCGETHIEFLSLDHVNNDGNIKRKAGEQTGRSLYHNLIKQGFPPGYQPLCFCCNNAKAILGACPCQNPQEDD